QISASVHYSNSEKPYEKPLLSFDSLFSSRKADGKSDSTSMAGGRFRELLKKYGKVALGVHFSVSAASITGLYVAVRNNVDVESVFDKLHLPGLSSKESSTAEQVQEQQARPIEVEAHHRPTAESRTVVVTGEEETKGRSRVAELAASSGGALALALLFNKALFPIRVPITLALTPPIARALARRGMIRNTVNGWMQMGCFRQSAECII
ncbi:unnamed protein product, partial [Linum tenue]